MHRGTHLELLRFCSPFGQFNGVPPTSLGGGWPRTLSFLGMPTVLVVVASSHNLLPRDEIVAWGAMVRGLGPRNHPLVLTKILKYGFLHEISPGLTRNVLLYKKQPSQNSLWPMNFLRLHQLLKAEDCKVVESTLVTHQTIGANCLVWNPCAHW